MSTHARGTTFQRTRSGPPRNSTDLVIVMPPNAQGGNLLSKRFSGSRISRMRQSMSMLATVDLDNVEWEQRVMNSWPKKCTFVVREILHTERAYIASLEEVILGYMMPLHGYLLSQGEGPNFIHTVFLNVNKLRQLHEELLNRLHSSCGDPHKFAEVFVETDFFQYREYCTHYSDANLFLQKSMAENEKLKMFMTQCQHDLDHPLPLHSHLIKPVQRILKYHLMLRELLKYFDEEDIAYPDIKEAMEKMKTVAETINTSFNGEKSETMASPSIIARRRSKEIKSLQRSRSGQQQQCRMTVADSASDKLQRSMEFEDSLTLLRGNRSTTNKRSERPASSTIGPGKRFRAPIMDLIGFYDTPKPTEGFSSDSASTLPPFPDTNLSSSQPSMEDGWVHVTPLSPRQSPSQIKADSPLTSGPSPNASGQTARSHPANSDTEPTPGKVIGKEESASSKRSPPILPKTKKEPLPQKKSTPIMQSKIETHFKKRNSITLSYELEPEAANKLPHPDKENTARLMSDSPTHTWHRNNHTSESKDAKTTELKTPIAVPPRPYSPPVVGRSNKPPLPKKPMSPPSVSLLPDKPILGHTAHRRLAHERNRNTHRRVIPGLPQNFVIDVDAEGGPVVSLPPSTQPPAPTSPPPGTFFPSMLRPVKNSSMVRASVFMRQHMLVGELKGGGRQAPAECKPSSSAAQMQQDSAERDAGEGEEGRKVPILPPVNPSGSPSNQHRRLKLKRSGALRSSHSSSNPPTTA